MIHLAKRNLGTARNWRPLKTAFKYTARTVVVGVVLWAGYGVYNERNPPDQLPQDPKLKTIAILGSGWAATSIIKDLDTEKFNVVIISPRNYFLFTPLLPSCTVGTIELRSIMQPIRYLTRFKKREVLFVEGDCTDIDPVKKELVVKDSSEITAAIGEQVIKYDYLIVACGAQNATFGVPGVHEHACFLKESWDAKKIRTRLMDCLETAAFPGQTESEIQRLLHMVVVGGGPTGVEYAAELHDFLVEDLLSWYPELAGKVRISLIEATPHVLPMFSKQLIEYTERHFAECKVDILNKTAVKQVLEKEIIVSDANKNLVTIPYGVIGNNYRNFRLKFKTNGSLRIDIRRGIVVDDHMEVKGASGIFALGDATATRWAPTAQVASGQGRYLAKFLNVLGTTPQTPDSISSLQQVMGPFSYDHLGTLAYIGSDQAIADLPGNVHVGGALTYYFWRSAYLSNLFATRNRVLVAFDWAKKTLFGRDISRE